MIKRKLFLFFITLVPLTVCAIVLFKNIIPGNKVRLKCRYMAYSCEECGPQYRIESIIKIFNGTVNKKNILGKDVKVVFRSSTFEKKLDSTVAECAICYDFYIDGELSYLSKKGYYILNADTCVTKLRNKDCCK